MPTMIDTTRSVPTRLLGGLAVLVLLLALLAPAARVGAQDEEEGEAEARTGLAEVPSVGGFRPGPITPAVGAVARKEGVPPVALQIEKAGVDAVIERLQIVDGVMKDPSGPWVVGWYEDLAALGEGSNVVMAGHVDYWNVGPAVFWYLRDLSEGDVIRVIAEDESVYEYQVQWMKNYVAAELTPEVIEEIVGETTKEALTLITCGGTFNYNTGEYDQRMVVRAVAVET